MAINNTGFIGEKMRVTGYGLYALTGLEVPNVGYIDFQYFDTNPEFIDFTVPEDITFGNINFYIITGQSVSDPPLKSGVPFFPVPRIDAVYPATQEANKLVLISGKSLSGANIVFFNNIRAVDFAYHPPSGGITGYVPTGYTTGPIKISGYNNSGQVVATSNFNFYGKVSLSGFSSSYVYEGDQLVVSGQNFLLSYVTGTNYQIGFRNILGGMTYGSFSGGPVTITGFVPSGTTSGYLSFLCSTDGTTFNSTIPLYVLRQPIVNKALKYYVTSGESNTLVGKNFLYVTGLMLSGLSYRLPKPVVNNGVIGIPSGRFGRSYFFANNTNLSISGSYTSDFNFGNGDFTIEFWMNPLNYASPRMDLLSFDFLGQSGFYFKKDVGSSNWVFQVTGVNLISIPTANIPANQWTKIALSRRSNSLFAFATGNSAPTSSSTTVAANILTNGAPLIIGSSISGSTISCYTGYLSDLRIVGGTGLYAAGGVPNINIPSFDIPNTKLFLQCNYSNLNFSGNRNTDKTITQIRNWVEDNNYGQTQTVAVYPKFTINAAGTSILFTGTGLGVGAYNLFLINSGNRSFYTPVVQTIKNLPVVNSVSVAEGYVGQTLELYGQNLYPGTQVFFQDTGSNGSVEANEEVSSYLVSSFYRNPKTITSSGVTISQNTSNYDDRSFYFSGISSNIPFIQINLTGSPLSTGKSFSLSMDFALSSGFISSSNKFLFSSDYCSAFCNSGTLFVSGFKFYDGSIDVASGILMTPTTGWQHLSINKTYISTSNVTGSILLNETGIYTFNSDFSLGTGVVLIGANSGINLNNSWSGYIDEISISNANINSNSLFDPLKRYKSTIYTEALVHANAGLNDDNIFDFNYLRLYVPNLSNLRKTDLVVTNGYGSYTGSPDQRFTFLKTPSITGVRTLTGTQGGTWTGYGNDIYYAQNLFLANNQITGATITNLNNNEFAQSIVFTIPDLASNGDFLSIPSNYYSYTFQSGLNITSGTLVITSISPTSGIANDLITVSGKFLNKVSSIRLGSQGNNYYDIYVFTAQSINALVFKIPYAYDIVDGPITFFGADGSVSVSSQSLTYINPSIYSIKPISAYYNDNLYLSGVNLSGIDFYASGANKDLVKFSGITYIGTTGVQMRVPREIVKSQIYFFYSGTNSGIAGGTKSFEPSVTISGVNKTGYRTKDPIIVTGINAYSNSARDLYISGFNLLTNTTGQFVIVNKMSVLDASSVTGASISQPYTGYTILSGTLNVSPNLTYVQNYLSLYGAVTPLGIGTSSIISGIQSLNVPLDGFIGSGRLLFQRNSFDPDVMFGSTTTIFAPLISVSGIGAKTGNIASLIVISGNNLNYVTGIKYTGISRLAVGFTGGANANVAVQVGYSTGVFGVVDTKSGNPYLYYKDQGIIKFFPPSMAGKAIHGKDVEDVRPITGRFILMTYMGEEYPVSGSFAYEPLINIIDSYINNDLTYKSDFTSTVSGYDGTCIAFSGQGLKNLVSGRFFSSNNGNEIESWGVDFNYIKRDANVALLNAAGGQVTGYIIIDKGAGYTFTGISLVCDPTVGVGNTAPIAQGIVSFKPPFVGMVTGVAINVNTAGLTANCWSGQVGSGAGGIGYARFDSPVTGFITQAPNALRFTGTNFATQSGDGSMYAAYYTMSMTFPTGNDFTVGEKLDYQLVNRAFSFTSMGRPFLVIQDPYNTHRIIDYLLTGANYEGRKDKLTFDLSQNYNYNGPLYTNEPVVKTSLIYPSGYNGKLLIYHLDKTNINTNQITVNFSTSIPSTASYVNASLPANSRYLTLRIEVSDPTSSFYNQIGSSQIKNPVILGRVGVGTYAGIGSS